MSFTKQTTAVNKKKMLASLEKNLGIVTPSAKDAEVGVRTHYTWLKEDEEYKAAVNSIAEIAVDFAESQLFKQMREGSQSSTIFYLKTKAKHRGYVERVEMTGADNSPIQIEVID